MKRPSVSIIVPVYNVEPYVEDSIRSVMRQTYTGPMECIVVDDCGTDNSMAIVEKLIAEYDGPITFKVLHHEHNRGLSAARNTGMDVATGDYYSFLDSDDELTNDCLEKLTLPLEDEWYDVVVGNVKYIKILSSDEQIVIKGCQEITLSDNTLLRPPIILRTHKRGWGEVVWNRLYRKKFLTESGLSFKEGLLYEDNLWSFQIACLASSLYIVNQVTYVHKKRKGSITESTEKEKRVKSLIVIIKEMKSFLEMFHIKDIDVFPIYEDFFDFILNYYQKSLPLPDYVLVYKNIRPYIWAPFRGIISINQYRIKGLINDIHYMMPSCIAPYWQFYLFKLLLWMRK